MLMSAHAGDDKTNLDIWRRENNNQALDKLIRRYQDNVFAFILYQSSCDLDEAYEAAANCMSSVLNQLKDSSDTDLPVA